VPELNRKIDAIPGQLNAIELYADAPGTYRGECLQYCGLQHAHMDFIVVAQPLAAFQAWLARQQKPAAKPTGAAERRGERLFLNGSCSSCHAIDGTPAHGYIGPNLTHMGSRSTLGSGVIPNTPEELAHWITSNQSIKPGNQMPDVPLPPAQLHALVAYLESLK
jgi:cytochrome c oxidase subunit 2